MYNGLSLDQAPPLSVVLRFFLTVPLFGIALSLLIFVNPHAILTPNHPLSLAAIHLMFLGIITMSMIGALFQMQSVLGGRPIPSPLGNAFLIHLFLVIGVLSLSGAFIFVQPILFVIASVFLGSSILHAANIILPLLFGGVTHDTLRGMRLALIALTLTAILGIIMASEYANETFSPSHDLLRTLHYSFGLLGWVAALIIAVAFQVIEMFYVTTAYSSWCKRNAFKVIAISLIFKAIWLMSALPFVWVFDLVMGALLVGFIVTTAKRLKERKRRVSDVSIWFWAFAMGLLSFSIILYALFMSSAYPLFLSMALVAFALFALAVILAMMGKIVPFLVWFHLSSAGYMDAPIMSNIIPIRRAKGIFWLFVITSTLVLVGVFYPLSLQLGALSAIAMFGLLLINLIKALKLYRYTLDHGTRFEQM
jgi:hypothetical protein